MSKRHIPERTRTSKSGQKKTQWHPPFCASMRLELIKDKDKLEYYMEYGLSTKALQIDLHVIKKARDEELENEIGRFFRAHNIIEYKSPEDDLDIDDFFKGIMYALLYKVSGRTTNAVYISDITVTFVRVRKPVKLIKELAKRDIFVERQTPGIYTVKWAFPCAVQILVTKEMNHKEHIWLTSLSDQIGGDEARDLIREMGKLTEKDDKEYADAVMQIAMEKNHVAFEEMKGDLNMCKAFWELFQPEIQEEMKKSEKRGLEIGEKCGLELGIAQERQRSEKIIKEQQKQLKMLQEQITQLLAGGCM